MEKFSFHITCHRDIIAKGRTHLVSDNVEHAINEDGPDEDVAKDSSNQRIRVWHHNGTIPVDGHERPGKRAGDNGFVDGTGVGRVAEVERRQVGKVENQDELSPAKVAPDKQHDKSKVEEVVENEVAADGGGGIQGVGIARPKMNDVDGLENE